jgi:hypothetical protein
LVDLRKAKIDIQLEMTKTPNRTRHSFLPPTLLAVGSVTVPLEEAGNPLVKKGIEYWRSLRGERRFPARDELTLRGLAKFLRFTLIVRVIDGGADYEFVYVGDAQTEAFQSYFKGLRVTQIEATAPEFGRVFRGVYDIIRMNAAPFVVRGRTNDESAAPETRYHESAFLPLGVRDVDHILIVGVRIPKPFWDVSEKDRNILTEKSRRK